ncbi:MAG: AAA family ATPase, partial [Anaerolineae bacterium]|nr:AAA family ATPase [Anaerolineae bacterium]
MTRTLVIANQKGGIGKTTAVTNIGRALSEKGYKVLLIDLDPQGGLSASFGVDSFRTTRSSYSLLMNPKTSLPRLLNPVGPYVALIPASIDLSTAE